MKAVVRSITLHTYYESDPDISHLDQFENAPAGSEEAKYYEEDQARKRSFHNGESFMVGLRAQAQIRFVHGEHVEQIGPVLATAGLWSNESYSDDSHFLSSWDEELYTLREMLGALGFTAKDIAAIPVEIVSTTDNPESIDYRKQFMMVDV